MRKIERGKERENNKHGGGSTDRHKGEEGSGKLSPAISNRTADKSCSRRGEKLITPLKGGSRETCRRLRAIQTGKPVEKGNILPYP